MTFAPIKWQCPVCHRDGGLNLDLLMSFSESKVVAELRAEVAALKEQLAAAQKDAGRLNWLETAFFEMKWDGTLGQPSVCRLIGPYRHVLVNMRGHTFREAIDTAIAAQEVKS